MKMLGVQQENKVVEIEKMLKTQNAGVDDRLFKCKRHKEKRCRNELFKAIYRRHQVKDREIRYPVK